MLTALQLSACWERGSLEPLSFGTATRSGELTAWLWRWRLLHLLCIRARKVRDGGAVAPSWMRSASCEWSCPKNVKSARSIGLVDIGWYFSKVGDGTKSPNVNFKKDPPPPLMAINCFWAIRYCGNIWLMMLPLRFLTLQVTSTMSLWGTSWLRAALKESNWRGVLMSLTLVSRSCLPRMYTIFGRSKRGS